MHLWRNLLSLKKTVRGSGDRLFSPYLIVQCSIPLPLPLEGFAVVIFGSTTLALCHPNCSFNYSLSMVEPSLPIINGLPISIVHDFAN